MGGVLWSNPEDSTPMHDNMQQPVLVGTIPSGPRITSFNDSKSSFQKGLPESVTMVKNPFVLKHSDTHLTNATANGGTELRFVYSALKKCQVAIFRHSSVSETMPLSTCSTPEEVPADWGHSVLLELPAEDEKSTEVKLPAIGLDKPIEVLLLVISPLEGGKWTQWHYLKFEPLKSSPAWYLSSWEEKMKCGNQTFSVMKIFSNKDEKVSSEFGVCLICQGQQANTMVLPCRHLCVCEECASKLGSRQPLCPVCRSVIKCMLQLSSSKMAETEMPGLQTAHEPSQS